MGWLAACNIFFDYVLWEEDGGADVLDAFGREVAEDEEEANVLAATAGRKKLDQLIDAYSYPGACHPSVYGIASGPVDVAHDNLLPHLLAAIHKKHLDEMMSRFGEALERLSSLRNGIVDAKVCTAAAAVRPDSSRFSPLPLLWLTPTPPPMSPVRGKDEGGTAPGQARRGHWRHCNPGRQGRCSERRLITPKHIR